MSKMNTNELKVELKKFTSTEDWWIHPLYRKYTYTDGVKFLAIAAEAYWLIDLIFFFQYDKPAVKAEPFQCWKLRVKDSKGTLTCEDGNDNAVHTHALDYTDFPLEEIDLWLTDNVLLLPSEY